MIPYIAAAASFLIPGVKNSSSSSRNGLGNLNVGANTFLLGVITGGCVVLTVERIIAKRRIRARMRNSYLAWLQSSESDISDELASSNDVNSPSALTNNYLHYPTPAQNINYKCLSPEEDLKDATLRTISSPMCSLTSSLHTVVICLPGGSQMRSRESKGLEIYYILEGSGYFMRDNCDEMKVSKGEVFSINPFTVRCLKNKQNENLIFIRASDNGEEYCSEVNYDAVIKCDKESNFLSGALVKNMYNYGSQMVGSGFNYLTSTNNDTK